MVEDFQQGQIQIDVDDDHGDTAVPSRLFDELERSITERSWRVPAQDVANSGYNLDINNPASKATLVHRPPEELLDSIKEKEQSIIHIVSSLEALLSDKGVIR